MSSPIVRQLRRRSLGLDLKEGNTDGALGLIISLVSGAVGGDVAGGVLREQSLGPVGDSIAEISGGGVGGTILMIIVGLIKQAVAK